MPEIRQKQFQKRQIAHKARISDLLNTIFTKDELSAGYIRLNDKNVSRVNIIAILVYKSEGLGYANSVIDDGSGRISLRTFENKEFFSKIDVGDVVLIIGKIREFNNERYILPEILKKVSNAEWLSVRKLELQNVIIHKEIRADAKDFTNEASNNFEDNIYSLIKKLDIGDGVSVDEIIKSSNNTEAEKILNKLLEKGDIFEIKPGKLKVLE